MTHTVPILLLVACGEVVEPSLAPIPARLSHTGLFVEGTTDARPELIAFSPQYPLWTDGAEKRRWVELPAPIDASDPDDWRFPPGTRFWKDFSREGRRVETRYLEALPDGTWRYATYVWDEDGRDATLAGERGARVGDHVVPSVNDCVACHEGRRSPVLGFGALQLSGDRDPLAPHGSAHADDVDLAALVDRGLVRGLPEALRAPRIDAESPVERAALGYLHGNCGGCHDDRGPLRSLGFVLWRSLVDDRGRETLRAASVFTDAAHPATQRVVAGDPALSMVAIRMGSRTPHLQMPPIGTEVVDEAALALVVEWIRNERNVP